MDLVHVVNAKLSILDVWDSISSNHKGTALKLSLFWMSVSLWLCVTWIKEWSARWPPWIRLWIPNYYMASGHSFLICKKNGTLWDLNLMKSGQLNSLFKKCSIQYTFVSFIYVYFGIYSFIYSLPCVCWGQRSTWQAASGPTGIGLIMFLTHHVNIWHRVFTIFVSHILVLDLMVNIIVNFIKKETGEQQATIDNKFLESLGVFHRALLCIMS